MRLFGLSTDPSPPAQDDRLVEGFGSHKMFVQCLRGEIQAMTDKSSKLKQVGGIALASFTGKRGNRYGKSTTATESFSGFGSFHERIVDVKGSYRPHPFGKQSTTGRRITTSHSTKN
jgi:hypothetical protein